MPAEKISERGGFLKTILFVLGALAGAGELLLIYSDLYELNETGFSPVNLLAMTVGIPLVLWFGGWVSNTVEKASRRFLATRTGGVLTRGHKRGEEIVSYVVVFVVGCLLIGLLNALFSPPVGYIVGGVALAWWLFLMPKSSDAKFN